MEVNGTDVVIKVSEVMGCKWMRGPKRRSLTFDTVCGRVMVVMQRRKERAYELGV